MSGASSGENYSLSFDGEDDFVEVPNFIKEAGTDMTINLYARGAGTMLCPETPQYESYFSYYLPEERVIFHSGIPNTESAYWYPNEALVQEMVNNFNFYSLTLENQEDGSTTLELFINGISQGQNSFSFATPSYSYLEIGRNVVEQNGNYDGNIDQVQIWDRVLSLEEIDLLRFNAPSEDINLIGYWNFNEGSGDLLTDLSGNGNDGIIVGAEWSNDVPAFGNSDPGLAFTSYTPSEDLLDNTRYHWQVTAEDLSGATFTTPLQSFIVNSENDLPSDFVLISNQIFCSYLPMISSII